jgi:hypothetical protein
MRGRISMETRVYVIKGNLPTIGKFRKFSLDFRRMMFGGKRELLQFNCHGFERQN